MFYWIFHHSLGLMMSESVSLNSAASLTSSNTKTQNKILLIKTFYLKSGARSMDLMQRPLLAATKLNYKLPTERSAPEKCSNWREGKQGVPPQLGLLPCVIRDAGETRVVQTDRNPALTRTHTPFVEEIEIHQIITQLQRKFDPW